ncbi:hypothetical protein [Gloeothece verrucosa]|uniref:Dentin matrix acidic phosphoprotein 1 n=1 Tax=Gloeothece verrucosa (strain PCC 7822) TaxID=497965 RepID=E0UGS3_GLOV7|nr:hypothetical protein [Gloeothece verrucosa]ADN14404.1 dentin matrix acidic phosphoprotein 1 [Gloeothece verrucosa PCC 7822]
MSSSQTSQNSRDKLNPDSQDLSQSYQPEEGAYDEQEQQEQYSRSSTERRDYSSQDITEAPEEA